MWGARLGSLLVTYETAQGVLSQAYPKAHFKLGLKFMSNAALLKVPRFG
jgi:hypothetical protein